MFIVKSNYLTEGVQMFDNITEYSLLRDFYGELLTPKQKEIFELYHDENLSLGEISEELGVSRQAVHDMLKNSEKALQKYEDKLGLVKRFDQTTQTIQNVDKAIQRLKTKYQDNQSLTRELNQIEEVINKLED